MPLTAIEQRIIDEISRRRDTLLRDLTDHVGIPTGLNFSEGLDRYRAKITQRLAALGARRTEFPGDPRPVWLTTPGQAAVAGAVPPTVVMDRRGSPALPNVLLAGHLDTVHDPASAFRELTLEPDGLIARGPGAADMKGGILIAVTALEVLHAAGIDLNWSFLLNSDEETGSFHSANVIRRTAREHDVGIALEPALPDGSLVVERMGTGQFKIEVYGRAAHVGRDFERGVSAVNTLARFIVDAATLARPAEGMILNIGPLEGGTVTNAVPDYAAAWGNVRYAGPAEQQRLLQELESLAARANRGPEGLPRVELFRDFNRAAKPKTPGVMRLAEAAKAAAGDLDQPMNFASTGGVCDGNIMQEAGLPTIDTLGVRGGNLHRPDEFIEVRSLVERCQLLALLLMRLTQQHRA